MKVTALGTNGAFSTGEYQDAVALRDIREAFQDADASNPKALYRAFREEVPEERETVPIGKAKIVREGTDVTITAFSIMVGKALKAAEKLAEEGISAEVIDLRTIRPLDTATIVASVQKTNRLVTCEEGWATCGIGSEIATMVMEQAFDHLDAPVARVAGEDVPMPYAANLEAMALPQVENIIEAAKSVCYRG